MVSHNWSLIFIGMKQTKKIFELKIGELCFSEFLNCFLTKLSGIDLHEYRVIDESMPFASIHPNIIKINP